jgi:hypothetical protein
MALSSLFYQSQSQKAAFKKQIYRFLFVFFAGKNQTVGKEKKYLFSTVTTKRFICPRRPM